MTDYKDPMKSFANGEADVDRARRAVAPIFSPEDRARVAGRRPDGAGRVGRLRIVSGTSVKVCRICEITKAAEAFAPWGRSGQRRSVCLECEKDPAYGGQG